MDSLKVSDAASAAVATHPRVTLEDIEAAIKMQYFTTADQAVGYGAPVSRNLARLTLCILETSNGFIVVGQSAAAVAENCNPELGRIFAREDAIRQLWPLMGFALRDKLATG